MDSENQITKGCTAIYKGQLVTVVRGAAVRFGDRRVVVERQADKQRFTVAIRYLQKSTA